MNQELSERADAAGSPEGEEQTAGDDAPHAPEPVQRPGVLETLFITKHFISTLRAEQ